MEKSRDSKYSITTYVLLFFAFAVMGFLWETFLNFINYGTLVKRGALYGPWLPIYGWGGLIALILFQKIKKQPVLTFFLSMVVCGIIEYGTSIYLEITKGVRYWDYTGWFLNINGRVCLLGLICFGLGCSAAIYYIGPLFNKLFQKIRLEIQIYLCVILIFIFLVDNICSSLYPRIGTGITTEIQNKTSSS